VAPEDFKTGHDELNENMAADLQIFQVSGEAAYDEL
jgi:hypothetical protein